MEMWICDYIRDWIHVCRFFGFSMVFRFAGKQSKRGETIQCIPLPPSRIHGTFSSTNMASESHSFLNPIPMVVVRLVSKWRLYDFYI